MDDYGIKLDLPVELENLQLPAPELVNFYSLRQQRIFYVDYEIDMSILELQREIIRINLEDMKLPIEKRKPIKILIDSVGGYLNETMSLVATIEMSKTPIYTVNMGGAYSGGCILLMAGHKRYAMPYSKALIHTGNGELGGTHEQVMAQSEKYEKEIKAMGDFICSHSKIDAKTYKKKKSQEWYLDTEGQINYGVVDEIVSDIFELLYNED